MDEQIELQTGYSELNKQNVADNALNKKQDYTPDCKNGNRKAGETCFFGFGNKKCINIERNIHNNSIRNKRIVEKRLNQMASEEEIKRAGSSASHAV